MLWLSLLATRYNPGIAGVSQSPLSGNEPVYKLTSRKVATVGQSEYEDGSGLRPVVSHTEARK